MNELTLEPNVSKENLMEKNNKPGFRDLLKFIALSFILSFVLGFILGVFQIHLKFPQIFAYGMAFFNAFTTIILLDYFMCRKYNNTVNDGFNLKPVNNNVNIILVVAGIILAIVGMAINIYLASVQTSQGGGDIEQLPIFSMINTNIYLFLIFILISPFYEEVLYRGLIYDVLIKKINPFWTILFSGILFSLAHFGQTNTFSIFYLMFMGVVFGIARYKTGSTKASILFHYYYNITVGLGTFISVKILPMFI